jgi:hypothetical protein
LDQEFAIEDYDAKGVSEHLKWFAVLVCADAEVDQRREGLSQASWNAQVGINPPLEITTILQSDLKMDNLASVGQFIVTPEDNFLSPV